MAAHQSGTVAGVDDSELYPVYAFYIVVDTSSSMRQNDAIDELNHQLPRFLQGIRDDEPDVAEIARISLIEFNDEPTVNLPLMDLADVEEIRPLIAQGGTAFSPVFRLLREVIPQHVRSLGAPVYRPAIFMLSDFQAMDRRELWERELDALKDPSFKYHPRIVGFGFGTIDQEKLKRVADPTLAYVATTTDPLAALRTALEVVRNSILRTVQHAADAGGRIEIDDAHRDFRQLEILTP